MRRACLLNPVLPAAQVQPPATQPLLQGSMQWTPATSFDSLVQQKEGSFTLLLVHRIIPKAIEFFLDRPADILPA
jgi:hypothetical protein